MIWLKNKKKNNLIIFLIFLFVGLAVSVTVFWALSLPEQETSVFAQAEESGRGSTEIKAPQTSALDQYNERLYLIMGQLNRAAYSRAELITKCDKFFLESRVPEKYLDKHLQAFNDFKALCLEDLSDEQLQTRVMEILNLISQ